MPDAPPPPARRRWLWLLIPLLAALLVGVWLGTRTRPAPPKPREPDDPFPLTPTSPSPYLNTRPGVGYVGSEACRKCHEDRHASFRHTGMGRSMAPVDPGREPPDASFDHAPSKRRYQVRRKDGRVWHRELLLTGGPEVLLAEYPLTHVVGSGRHSLTYAVEADGFLVESPVTWYRSKKAWGMSPGYDTPHQAGFERAVGEGCLTCHAGRADALDGSLHRMRLVEPAIGCERCHGPGQLHVEQHRGGERSLPARVKPDITIVNPARLPRELGEAVCQQCHLRSNATIVGRGRALTDFRPGLPREDFFQDYALDVPDASMTVVGHVEQMHLSKCYQGSKTLTCLTCHSPHDEPAEERRVGYYRAICVSCHEKQPCKADPAVRRKASPEDSCIHCHMPAAPTEIPHLAFTHHRIGRHDRGAPKAPAPERQELRPFLPLSRLSEIDRRRSLGLAHLETANRSQAPAERAHHQRRAMELLGAAKRDGLPDGVLEASLARLSFELERDGVGALAQGAMARTGLAGQDRCNALYLLADDLVRQGRHEQAREAVRELTRLRRHSLDWMLLARIEHSLGDLAAEEEALSQVVRINPRQWRVHQRLAERHRGRGDKERAHWHEQRAVP